MKTNQLDSEFRNVSLEDDTKIHSLNMKTIGGFRCRYERWSWEGTQAESLIFLVKDVAHLSDDELVAIIIADPKSLMLTDVYTLKRIEESGFVFFNYDFHVDGVLWTGNGMIPSK
jgi:hypothetical protein